MAKKLYFTDDFSEENVTKLQEKGFILRDVKAYRPGDFVEAFDEVAGDVPAAYLEKANQLQPDTQEAEAGGESEEVETDVSKMNKTQIQEHLTKAGIEFPANATKDELVALTQPKQDDLPCKPTSQ